MKLTRDPVTSLCADLIERMAADLIRLNACSSERDAIRALSSNGYRLGDVAALAGDALDRARATIKGAA